MTVTFKYHTNGIGEIPLKNKKKENTRLLEFTVQKNYAQNGFIEKVYKK